MEGSDNAGSDSGILRDLEVYGVGADWNTSNEKQRATLFALQSSRSDHESPQSSAPDPALSSVAFDSPIHHAASQAVAELPAHRSLSATSGQPLPSSPQIPPAPDLPINPMKNVSLGTFSDKSDQCSGNSSFCPGRDHEGGVVVHHTSHSKNESFSFPLGIHVELGTKSSSQDRNGHHHFETSADRENLKMKAAPRTRFYSEPLRPNRPTQGTQTQIQSRVSEREEYEAFRTRSGRLNNSIQQTFSRLQSRIQGKDPDTPGKSMRVSNSPRLQSLPARRYFAALRGPELETLKDSEDVILPLDKKWPFLLRFPISSFGISLGLGSQTMLWKNLTLTSSVHLLHVPKAINIVLWCLTLTALIVLFTVYSLKFIFYFQAVHREFHHPVRVNFFFAPWIAGLFLTIGVPPVIATTIHPALWCVFMVPIFFLELKIYGQWLSGGERRLSRVANPSTHLSVVGNFVGAILGALVGWKEIALFFWSVGLAHYLVVFVTLYQRLPTNETLPKDLHPVFFLFVAAPSAASVAWEKITGDFDYVSRMVYFVAIFLFSSLVVRINFFRGFRFSIAWWAYTFPMTAASIATVRYSEKVRSHITLVMAIALTVISSITVLLLFFTTIFHLWSGRLFPNDMAIAITPLKKTIVKETHEKEDIFRSQNGELSKES